MKSHLNPADQTPGQFRRTLFLHDKIWEKDYAEFSGTASYKRPPPAAAVKGWWLDLGVVKALTLINGKPLVR